MSSILRGTETIRPVNGTKALDASMNIDQQEVKQREHLAKVKDHVSEKKDPENVIETKNREAAGVQKGTTISQSPIRHLRTRRCRNSDAATFRATHYRRIAMGGDGLARISLSKDHYNMLFKVHERS